MPMMDTESLLQLIPLQWYAFSGQAQAAQGFPAAYNQSHAYEASCSTTCVRLPVHLLGCR